MYREGYGAVIVINDLADSPVIDVGDTYVNNAVLLFADHIPFYLGCFGLYAVVNRRIVFVADGLYFPILVVPDLYLITVVLAGIAGIAVQLK